MPISEALLKKLMCCIYNDGHIAMEPVTLECGAIACKECIKNAKEEVIHCFYCNKIHEKKNFNNSTINKSSELMVQSYINELFLYIEENLKTVSCNLKGTLIKLHTVDPL